MGLPLILLEAPSKWATQILQEAPPTPSRVLFGGIPGETGVNVLNEAVLRPEPFCEQGIYRPNPNAVLFVYGTQTGRRVCAIPVSLRRRAM